MKGLELSYKYFKEVGRPVLQQHFGEYIDKMAFGLVGEGSECFGFDDDISTDHDFGAGFCIWLNAEDYAEKGEEIQKTYNELPKEFMGFKAVNYSHLAGKRTGVMEISSFYSRFVGRYQPPATLEQWLYLPEDKLATAVNGKVFEDNLGDFSKIRTQLSKYYPEDVRLKKIAARCAVMAQAGQYNYPRCMRRNDIVAAQMALGEFIKASLSLLYLLNRKYAPYYKWQFYGLKAMKENDIGGFVLPSAVNQIEKLAMSDCQIKAWENKDKINFTLNMLDEKVEIIERICRMVVNELKNQGLTQQEGDFLQPHAEDVMKCIKDSQIRSCHILQG